MSDAEDDHASEMDALDRDAMVADMVRYMLNQSVSKLPIRRADIVTSCLRGKARLFQSVYEKAAEILKKNYGMCIYKAAAVTSSSIAQFLCVSKTANAVPEAMGEAEARQMPVLFLVLAYIYMKGGQLADHSVFAFLDKCGLPVGNPTPNATQASQPNSASASDLDEVEHPFGDLRKLVSDTFVKQMYLRRTKITSEASNEVQIQLEWGQRADLEFAKRDVLGAVAQLMGRTAESFQKQFDELQQAAEEQAAANRQAAEAVGGDREEGAGVRASQRSRR